MEGRRAQAPADPTWRAFAHAALPQYALLAALALALAASDRLEPRTHAMYGSSDREWWDYSHPTLGEAVPDWSVPLLTAALPLLVLAAAHAAGAAARAEAHAMGLGLLFAVVFSGLATNLIKTQAARPRPDFVQRCWPSGVPRFAGGHASAGLPLCDDGVDAHELSKGLRSFPSGHASWCGAGLGFLALWAVGKLRVLRAPGRGSRDGSGARPGQLLLALLPLLAALAVAVQRYVADKHHVGDIAAGLAIGLASAVLFFMQARAGLDSSTSEQEREAAALLNQ